MDSAGKEASDYTVSMHLALDIREACRARRAGKGQWTYGFAQELLRRGHALTLFTDAALPTEWDDLLRSRTDVTIVHPVEKGLRWHFAVARTVKKHPSIDVYVSTVSYIVPMLLRKHTKTVIVVHDLIAFQNEPHDRKATLIERITLGPAVKHAYRVCTVSETTRDDLLKRYTFVDTQKVIPVFAAPHRQTDVLTRSEEIILCVSTLCPRKNQHRLINAYASLPDDLKKKYSLILVGARGWDDEYILELAQKTPGVEWKNYLSDAEIEVLYSRCVVFAYPSLYEGFGLPIVEAMQRGIPVLTTNVGSMKEVAGDAAVLVDSGDTQAIAHGLKDLLSNAALRTDMATHGPARAALFTWKRTVDLFLASLSD